MDIGGSGVKTAVLKENFLSEELNSIDVEIFQSPDWSDFVRWLDINHFLNCQVVGISCAGLIKNSIVKLCRVANWQDRDLLKEIDEYTRTFVNIEKQNSNKIFQKNSDFDCIIKPHLYLLNDAEAHLMAHIDLYRNPIMTISLGTSIGFAISDANGKIVKALNGFNFDIGEMCIPTSSSKKEVWWALGSNGLNEIQTKLGQEHGTQRFGYRLGSFLVNLCSIFRPKTVVLSGGITEMYWNIFKEPMFLEFDHAKPDWLDKTDIVKSPHCINAALVGMAKYVNLHNIR